MTEALHLCGILQQTGNVDVEKDLIDSLYKVKNISELQEILDKLRRLTNLNQGRSSDYR